MVFGSWTSVYATLGTASFAAPVRWAEEALGAASFDAEDDVAGVEGAEVRAGVDREDDAAFAVCVLPDPAASISAVLVRAVFAVLVCTVFVLGALVLDAFEPVDEEPAALAPDVFDPVAFVPEVFGAAAVERFAPLLLVPFVARLPVVVRAGESAAAVFSAPASVDGEVELDGESGLLVVAERRAAPLPERLRRSAAARAIPVARSWAPARSRWAFSSSREAVSPEKNMSTGRLLPLSASELVAGRVRVRSSCSGAGVEPAPGIRAPSPRPSPRFCVMAVVLPRNVVA
ncbi:MAG: hypothetical protein ACTHX0_08715, partial [Brachybacterium sp.]